MHLDRAKPHRDVVPALAMGLRSEEKVIYEPIKRTAGDYTPQNLRNLGTR